MITFKNNNSSQILFILLVFPFFGYTQNEITIDFKDDFNFPKGKMGQVVQETINMFNANDPEKINQFITKHNKDDILKKFSLEDIQEYLLDNSRKTGGVNFYSIRTYTPSKPDRTIIIVKDNNFDTFYSFVLSFTNEVDYIVDSLWFSSADVPLNIMQPDISETQLINKTTALLNKLSQKDVFSGAMLIAKGNTILFEKAYGEASKRFHVANTIDTKFNLGSMNKMFTAVAIMQLIEKEKLTLQDPISKYVDESWLPKKITDQVTIHHLLSHTSGLGSYFNKTFFTSSRELYRTIEQFKPLVKGSTLSFTPGEKYRYSNTGMLLLGVIIQKSTEQDYFEYIKKHIYNPAGMTNSDSFEMDEPVENLAIGYIPMANNSTGWKNNIFKHVIKGGPAGGGFSTIKDLNNFALALSNEKLVSKSSLELLWTDHTKSGYGYGFTINNSKAGKVVGHGGGFPGLNSELNVFLDNGYVIVIMSNYDRGADSVAKKIRGWVERLRK